MSNHPESAAKLANHEALMSMGRAMQNVPMEDRYAIGGRSFTGHELLLRSPSAQTMFQNVAPRSMYLEDEPGPHAYVNDWERTWAGRLVRWLGDLWWRHRTRPKTVQWGWVRRLQMRRERKRLLFGGEK